MGVRLSTNAITITQTEQAAMAPLIEPTAADSKLTV
jgi:hypothetical protein